MVFQPTYTQGTDMTIASVGISVSSLHFCAQTFLRVLVQRGLALVKRKIHPTTVISGYRLAMKEAIKFIKKHMVLNTSDLGTMVVKQAAMVCTCELVHLVGGGVLMPVKEAFDTVDTWGALHAHIYACRHRCLPRLLGLTPVSSPISV